MPVKNPAKVAELLRISIQSLKSHFSEFPFVDANAEARFFKYEKPLFYSEYVFALELFTVESNKPNGDELVVKNYLERELQFVRRFFDQYRFLFQYYLIDGNELDRSFFTRAGANNEILLPESPVGDPDFSTPADFIFAKFIALERLQEYLISQLYPAKQNGSSGNLRWTGDKTNLIELAYGIYNTAQVNDGDVRMVDIISWLEKGFSIQLPRYLQMYSEIKGRKSVSKTRYLDHMAKMINRHIEFGDAFVPEKPRPVSGSKSAVKN